MYDRRHLPGGVDGFSVLASRNTPFTVRYEELTAIIAKAMQQIGTISGTFKHALIAWLADASNGIGKFFAGEGHFSNELCVGDTCVTPAQFQAMVAASTGSGQAATNQSRPSTQSTAPSGSTHPVSEVGSTTPVELNATSTSDATSTKAAITVPDSPPLVPDLSTNPATSTGSGHRHVAVKSSTGQ